MLSLHSSARLPPVFNVARNFYSDDELISAARNGSVGGFDEAFLDFYQVHYEESTAEWAESMNNVLLHSSHEYNFTKPVLIGAASYKGGGSLSRLSVNSTVGVYRRIYSNGWAGFAAWQLAGGSKSDSYFDILDGVLSLDERPHCVSVNLSQPNGHQEDATPNARTQPPRLSQIRARLDSLAADAMDFWMNRTWDGAQGGCIATLNRLGVSADPRDKELGQHADFLHAFSSWHQTREPSTLVSDTSHLLYNYLLANFSKAMPNGTEYRWKLRADGTVLDDSTPVVMQAQAISALVSYGRAFGVGQAIEEAMDVFLSVHARVHDRVNQGYRETNHSQSSTRFASTQRRLLQAFVMLYQATNDSLVLQQAQELTSLILHRTIGNSSVGAFVYETFDDAWTWLPSKDSYPAQHIAAFETARLVLESLRSLPFDEQTVRKLETAAVQVVDSAISMGFDTKFGGFITESDADGTYPIVSVTSKFWSVQSEALWSLWRVYQHTGMQKYLDLVEATLTWVEQKQRDQRPSRTEWFTSVTKEGFATLDSRKGSSTKTALQTTLPLTSISDEITASRPR